ncbi:MFS transporter [Acidocella facilis]|uniref:MFS transporter n=1 Tax=Acidocella facilis TaxID=525 RepID=UPI001F46C9DE|nr:MFS transporter [Acidocella facilis]
MSSEIEQEIEPEVPTKRMRTTAIIIAVALFMQNLDSTVVTTALPAMAKSFHIDPLYMSVSVTSYLIALSVFVPASGWVADRFGARQVFRAAVIIFTLGSVFCGIAPSLLVLVAARVVQGLGGAMMLPVGRLLLLRSVSRSQMVAAMAWLTVPALLGPVLGPPLGGLIVSVASWRWVFDINVPIGIAGAIAVSMFIPDVREEGRGGQLDRLGLLFSGGAMAFLMIGMETIGRGLIPLPWTLLAFLLGILACLGYWRHARNAANPILDFSLFRVPTFSISLTAGTFFRVAVGAVPFLLPLMLQLGFGKTPLQSGMITFASAAGAIAMKPAATPLLTRFGFRSVLIWNGVAATLMLAASALFSPAWPAWLMALVLLVAGIFRSLEFTAYNVIAYGDIPRPRMSAATTLYTTVQQLSLTMGVVVGAASLEISSFLTGHTTPSLSDYDIAFIVVSLVALLASPLCARLPRDAGDALTGHRTG